MKVKKIINYDQIEKIFKKHKNKKTLIKYFHNSFIFLMNDEVIDIGYYKMAHNLLCLSTGLKK